ncbi:MAG: Gfo/Idh/MocA family oxidoreductase [Prevotella sp.]|nr:Gfo/Idh/MocA family oxidoreductase [Prevotella sp.]MBR6086730.1 Gfo/Idh/MocA family oxidoreductase [Prevotella sp.]
MTNIRWGFIGCGEVTEYKSGPAFNNVEGSSIVAVMSRNADKARSYAERHGIGRWYTDPQALVDDPDVNAVYIATPPSSHATYAIMAMRAGKPVYVEKPLAASYEDCTRINHVCQETHVPCFVAYYRRYLPYFQKVESLLKGGTIGKVLNVQVRFACPPRQVDYNAPEERPWRIQPDIAGGGYFYDLAPHQLDLLQQLFGVIVKAEGHSANIGGLYEAEDTVSASFLFENNLPGSGSWCFAGHEAGKDDRIELIGTDGILTFSVFNYDPIHLYTTGGMKEFTVPNPQYVQQPLIQSVVETLQGRGDCQCTALSATPTNWAMDRILGKI